jgi:hypothetical protein
VSPMSYEHHLHIKSKAIPVTCVSCEVRTSFTYRKQSYPCNRTWWTTGVFPVTYEHHLHIKSKFIPVICMFPVRYGHNLNIESKAIPVTGHGGPQVCFL